MYRFTTYRKTTIKDIQYDGRKILWQLQRKNTLLELKIEKGEKAGLLFAPDDNDMKQKVTEYLDGKIHCKLYHNNSKIFDYFKEAKKLGDVLVVSVTDDEYVNKGPGRPAFPIQSRLKFLSEIQTIDFVYVSKSPTARDVILNLKPRYYCKGNDYPIKNTILDDNLKSEINAVKKIKGQYKQINQAMFSSSKIINDYNLSWFIIY